MSRLIVIDGLDGCGKATQCKELAGRLEGEGLNQTQISYPDYKQPSSTLVQLYLQGDISKDVNAVNPYAASVFYSADRYISYEKHWKDSWVRGSVVVADRYTPANIIHQMCKLPSEQWVDFIAWMEELEYNLLGLPAPDLVIILDLDLEVSASLLEHRYAGDASKLDIHEVNKEYQASCQKAARFAAELLGWTLIRCNTGNAMRSIDDIAQEIWTTVQPLIAKS